MYNLFLIKFQKMLTIGPENCSGFVREYAVILFKNLYFFILKNQYEYLKKIKQKCKLNQWVCENKWIK